MSGFFVAEGKATQLLELRGFGRAQPCLSLSVAKGEDGEPGPRDFSVRENTCGSKIPPPQPNCTTGVTTELPDRY